MSRETESSGAGIGLGSVVAVVVSWSINHSIGWAIVHGCLSWFYVIYVIAGCGKAQP